MMIRPRHLVLSLLSAAVLACPAQADLVPLGQEFQINTFTTGAQRSVAVAMNASGRFIVVWDGPRQDPFRDVSARRFDSAGAAVGSDFRVNTNTWLSQYEPAVAMDPLGRFVVAWASYLQDGSGAAVIARRYTSGGAPLGDETQVNTYTRFAQRDPAVAMDASGGFVALWDSDLQGEPWWGVMGRRYDNAGARIGGEFHVNTYTTDGQFGPSIAMDASGGFVVVWNSYGQDGSSWGVFGRRFDSSGARLGGEFQANTYATDAQIGSAVAMDPSGSFVVAWGSAGQDGSAGGVFGQRFDSTGAPMGGEFQVNTYTTDDQSGPAVAMGSAGSFVIAWTSYGQDGSNHGVFGRQFDRTGTPSGGEFQINTHTTFTQRSPAVAMASTGDFVVAWISYGQDGSGAGVFGRRFCLDSDVDGLCDAQDVVVTTPSDGATLDCSDPRLVRPTIAWDAGNYDRFRVFFGTSPSSRMRSPRTTRDGLLSTTVWMPPARWWRRACHTALATDPMNPVLYLEVLGVDTDLPKSDPHRRTFSQIVGVAITP